MEDQEKEMWRGHKEDMKKMRDSRRAQFHETIIELRNAGFEVVEITPFQYRINECLDIYPQNKRYHDIIKNERGDIRGIKFSDFVRKYFGIK